MRLYDITEDNIAEVLSRAEQVETTIKGRFNASWEVRGQWLRVTYKEEEIRYVIVTVTPLDRK